jgi:hypothetical protein
MDGSDLGGVARGVRAAIERAGPPPRGARVEVRGQAEPMRLMFAGLSVGLALAVGDILLLTAYFQRPKLALVAVAASRAEASERLSAATRTRAEASLVRWKSEYERVRKYRETHSISNQELDVATDQLRYAEAALAEAIAGVDAAGAAVIEARAQRDRAAADIGVAEARKALAEAERRRQETLVAYGQVRAPFDGVITRRHVHVGHLLQPTGAQATNGRTKWSSCRGNPPGAVGDSLDQCDPDDGAEVAHLQAALLIKRRPRHHGKSQRNGYRIGVLEWRIWRTMVAFRRRTRWAGPYS